MFYTLLKQKSGGCDSSIGCGEKLVKMQSTNVTAAIEELEKGTANGQAYLASDAWLFGEDGLKSVTILEVVRAIEVDLKPYRDVVIKKRLRLRNSPQWKEQQRAEYERLKKMFEP